MLFVIKHEQSRLPDSELSAYLSDMVAHASGLMDSSVLQFMPVFSSDTYSIFELPYSPFRPKLHGLSVAIVDFCGSIIDDSSVVSIEAVNHFKKLGGDMAHLHFWVSGGVIANLENFEIFPLGDRGALCITWSPTDVKPEAAVEALLHVPSVPTTKH